MPEKMKGIKLKNLDSLLMQKKELCAAAWKDKKVVFFIFPPTATPLKLSMFSENRKMEPSRMFLVVSSDKCTTSTCLVWIGQISSELIILPAGKPLKN